MKRLNHLQKIVPTATLFLFSTLFLLVFSLTFSATIKANTMVLKPAMQYSQELEQKKQMLKQVQMLLKQSNGTLAPQHLGMLNMVVQMTEQNEDILDNQDKKIIQSLKQIVQSSSQTGQQAAITELVMMIDHQLDGTVAPQTAKAQPPKPQTQQRIIESVSTQNSIPSVQDNLARMQATIQAQSKAITEQSAAAYQDHKQSLYSDMSVDEKLAYLLSEEAAVDLVELKSLIKQGADIEKADASKGNRPLHLAAMHGKQHAVKLLLSLGARPSSTNKTGMTPTQLARNENHNGVVSMLRTSIAAVSTSANGTGNIAAEQTNIEYLQLSKFFHDRPSTSVIVKQYTQANLDLIKDMRRDLLALNRAHYEHTPEALNNIKTIATKYAPKDIDLDTFNDNIDFLIKEAKPIHIKWNAENGVAKEKSARELQAFIEYADYVESIWSTFEVEVDTMQRSYDANSKQITKSDMGTMEKIKARSGNEASYIVALQKMIDKYKLDAKAEDWRQSWDRNGHVKGNAIREKSKKGRHNALYGDNVLYKLRQAHMPQKLQHIKTTANKIAKKIIPEYMLKVGEEKSISTNERVAIASDTSGFLYYFINHRKERYGNAKMMTEFAKLDTDNIRLSTSDFKALSNNEMLKVVTGKL